MSFDEKAGMADPEDIVGGSMWTCRDENQFTDDEIWSDKSVERVLEGSKQARELGHAIDHALPVLTDQEQRDRIRDRIIELFCFEIKPDQLEALYHLIIQKQDLILIAGTSFGKSLIFQAAPLILGSNNTCLVIMPLKAIEQEQDLGLRKIPEAKPFVLDGENNTKQKLLEIARGSFTHGKNMWNRSIVTANISQYSQVQR